MYLVKSRKNEAFESLDKIDLRRAALKGFKWMALGTIGQHLLSVGTLLILVRYLTPEQFGIASAATIVVGFLRIFSLAGVGPSIIQKPVLSTADIGTANLISISLGVLLAAIVIALSPNLANFFSMPLLEDLVVTMAFVLPFVGLGVVGQSLLYRDLQFRRAATYEFLSYLVGYSGVAVPLALLGYGVWSLALGYMAQVSLYTLLIICGVPKSRKYSFNLRSAASLLYMGGGFSSAKFFNYVAGQGDNIIVGRYLGAESLGTYGRAYELMSMPAILIGGVLDKVLFPVMSSIQDNSPLLSRMFTLSVSAIAMISIPISIYLWIMADEIIWLLFGEAWLGVVPIFKVLGLCLFFRMAYKISDSVARATGKVYERAARQFLYAGAVLGLSYVGSFWGVTGVAVGVFLAIALNFILMSHLTHRIVDFKVTDLLWAIVRHTIAPIVCGAALVMLREVLLNNNVPIVLSIVVSAVLYSIAGLLFWYVFPALVRNEINFIKTLKNRKTGVHVNSR